MVKSRDFEKPSLLAMALGDGLRVVKGVGPSKYPFKNEKSWMGSVLYFTTEVAKEATPCLRLPR